MAMPAENKILQMNTALLAQGGEGGGIGGGDAAVPAPVAESAPHCEGSAEHVQPLHCTLLLQQRWPAASGSLGWPALQAQCCLTLNQHAACFLMHDKITCTRVLHSLVGLASAACTRRSEHSQSDKTFELGV